ncbi:MAG: DUF354 domain-containing protein [Bacteroidales bacterium]|nr:DUF354 domain-containing protein [Bacteroidales bacterium]
MLLLFDINHPSYYHAFKNAMIRLKNKGHSILITASQKDITYALLNEYSIYFISTGVSVTSLFQKIIQSFKKIFILIKTIRQNNIKLIVSFESPYAAIAGWLCRRDIITFSDTESANFIHKITGRLSSTVVVPTCFKKCLSPTQIVFNGYKELAYLLPMYFQPEKKILQKHGINMDEPYAIIRFVSFNALHDKGFTGFTKENKLKLVKELSLRIKVFISSESTLIPELKQYLLKISPHSLHHILAFASLYIGESTTMAAEAAILGIPSICVNHMNLGYIQELAESYGLIFKYNLSEIGQQLSIEKALEIASSTNIKKFLRMKREKMIKDKIDVTAFMVWFIENYPKSGIIMKENQDYQYKFK